MFAELLEGQRRGTFIIFDGVGFFYHKNKERANRAYLKCIDKKCSGASFCTAPVVNGSELTCTSPHNHDANPDHRLVLEFKRSLSQRSETEAVSLKRIFDDESRRFPIEVVSQVGFSEVSSTMAKKRKKVQPNVPRSMVELGHRLAEDSGRFGQTASGGQFFRCCVYGEGEYGASVVFASPHFLEKVQCSRELHIDGTFKVTPRSPNCYQLVTIMSVHFNHAFPVISILMEKKTEGAYLAVFTFCKSLMANMQVQTVVTDFEKALQSAASSTFNTATVRGCWFHFASCLFKRARKIGLYGLGLSQKKKEVRFAIRMAMSLPLLPADHIPAGYNYIENYIEVEGIKSSMETFMKYLKRTWIIGVGPVTLSCFGEPSRTNNFQESYHHQLKENMGIHPHLWQFIDALKQQESSHCKKYASLANGRRTTQPRKKLYLARDATICSAQRNFLVNFDVGELLTVIANSRIAEEEQRMAIQPAASDTESSDDNDQPEPDADFNEERENQHNLTANNDEPHPVLNEGGPQQVEEYENQPNIINGHLEGGPRMCAVCFGQQATHVVVPCGHWCLCAACAQELPLHQENLKCPLCRAPSSEFIIVF